ncbi:MAG: hypothetical protein ABGX22_01440, partial [Pirellulaceae bacterium]
MRILRRWLTIVLIVGIGTPVRGQAVTADSVRRSITRGVAFLKSKQNDRTGSWNGYEDYPEGLTSLVTLALLSAGEDVRSPHIQRALAQVRAVGRPVQVYSTALRTMVLCMAEPEKDRLAIEENVRWLEAIQTKSGTYSGAWSYGRNTREDNSNTQFALLA